MIADRVLVTYATRAGSTTEVADAIAQTLREAGVAVDVQPVDDVRDIQQYTRIILGTAIRAGRILPEAFRFAQRFRAELQAVPVAYFVVCLTMKEDTPEHRQTVQDYLEPLITVKEPVSIGLFAGAMQHDHMGFFARFFMTHTQLGKELGEGDWRDWDAIHDWALALVRHPA